MITETILMIVVLTIIALSFILHILSIFMPDILDFCSNRIRIRRMKKLANKAIKNSKRN